MIDITMVRDYNKDYNIKFDGLKVIDLSDAELKKAKDNMKVNSFNRVIKEEKKLFKEDL